MGSHKMARLGKPCGIGHALVLVGVAWAAADAIVELSFTGSPLAAALHIGVLLLGVATTFVLGREWLRCQKRGEGLARALVIGGIFVSGAMLLCFVFGVLIRESIGAAIYCGLSLGAAFGLGGYLIPTAEMPRPFFTGLLALALILVGLIALSPLLQMVGAPMDARSFRWGSWPFLLPGALGLAIGHRRLL